MCLMRPRARLEVLGIGARGLEVSGQGVRRSLSHRQANLPCKRGSPANSPVQTLRVRPDTPFGAVMDTCWRAGRRGFLVFSLSASNVVSMMRNPDPKPGRWVLPLVVLGMVLFTWVWVNRLEPVPVDDSQPVSTTSATTTTSADEADDVEGTGGVDEGETTTTTLLPPEIDLYLNNLAEDKLALAELVAEMNAVNEEWDNRSETGVPYGDTEVAMEAISEQALIFAAAVELHRPPETVTGLVEAHEGVFESANAVAAAAEEALAGLRSSDSGERRRAALVEFRAAAASFNEQVDQISDITLQGLGR